MRLAEVFRFELAYQLRRRSTWIYVAAGALLAVLAAEGFVDDARSGGFPIDAPIVVAAVSVLAGLMGLLVVTPVAGDAASRDARWRMTPLLRATPLRRRELLLGRFSAAFVVAGLFAALVPAGLALVLRAPGTGDALAGLVGPFRPAAYAGAFLLLGLPNAFVATALLFSAAVVGRRVAASYLCGAVLFVGTMLCKDLLADHFGHWRLAGLLDPFGLTALGSFWTSWSAAEKGSRLLGAEPSLLANRLLWLAVAAGALALAHLRFRFAHEPGAESGRRRGRRRDEAPAGSEVAAPAVPVTVPRAARRFGVAGRARQLVAVARSSGRRLVAGRAFLAVPAATVLLVLLGPELIEGPLGTPTVPVTAQVLLLFDDFTLGVLVAGLASWFAGELVWSERDARMGELAGAAPVPSAVAVGGRLLGLGLALAAVQAIFLTGALAVQALQGFHRFEPGVLLRVFFEVQLVDRLLFAVLALALHVVVDQKYLGHLAVMAVYLYSVFAPSFGLEHPLWAFGAAPGWSYTDLVGFGGSLAPHRWLQLHWAGWALLWTVAATALWVRGAGREPLRHLLRRPRRPSRPLRAAAAAGALTVLASGAFVLHATTGSSHRPTSAEGDERRAAYERLYGEHAGRAQPVVAATRLRVEIDPLTASGRGRVEVRARQRLENRSGEAIETVHLTTHPDVATGPVRFDRAARPVVADDRLGYRVHRLEEPLRPGESLEMEVDVVVAPRGFPVPGVDTSVTAAGVLFENLDYDAAAGRHWLPWVGYLPSRELGDPGARRAHGLPDRPAVPPLEDRAARLHPSGRERIDFEAVIGTAPGLVAVAPGRLVRTWVEPGGAGGARRWFHYATEAPIRNAWAVASGGYAVHRTRWRDVRIEVLHHPDHRWNVERMVRSARASLDAYSRRFGPYPHRWLRFVEIPGVGTGLRAYPGTILFSEGFAAAAPESDGRGIDLPFAVIAHEVAHQWWGHRLVPAPVEGAPVLTESLAWYSALGVVEEALGRDHLDRLLALMRQEYDAPHARPEVPLLRASDRLAVYRTGPLAMHELAEEIGRERVDAALRRLLAERGGGAPPYATSLDLYRELRAVTPASRRPFLRRLFEEVPE